MNTWIGCRRESSASAGVNAAKMTPACAVMRWPHRLGASVGLLLLPLLASAGSSSGPVHVGLRIVPTVLAVHAVLQSQQAEAAMIARSCGTPLQQAASGEWVLDPLLGEKLAMNISCASTVTQPQPTVRVMF
jgi:hypothetical protein